jgi:5-methylcytosine-specific restriction endonuclease McrA
MNNKTLVLNQDYRALTTCAPTRAFLLVFMNKAEVVTDVKDGYFRTVSSNYPIPSVIRLRDYVHLPYKGVILSRQNIFRRDSHRCQYCGSTYDLTLDHVLPKSRKGGSTWDNLVTACKNCNARKGDQTPEEARMPLRQKPFKPSFLMFLRDFSGPIYDEWIEFLGRKN